MGLVGSIVLCLINIALAFSLCLARNCVNLGLEFSYITASPLGSPQEVIAVNGQFPGPTLNATTNHRVIVHVNNKLDENLLITWPGVQMRRASWQDGVLGTNCPIPPNSSWTYQFQVKDQIGSFFYFPSLHFQRAAGGFGSFTISNLSTVPVPFNIPDGDIEILIGDWYTRNHKALRKALDAGDDLGMPDGVLINGKGPYRYDTELVPDGIGFETIKVEPGKTYRIRVHNVGVSTCLNFRIQNHNLLLAETEGFYTIQKNYTNLDIHVGQSYSFLVTMDQNASSNYYIVASARFVNQSLWQRVTGVAILQYSTQGIATGPLPDPPNDVYDKSFVVNQAMSIRQHPSASGAHLNPQDSFNYSSIILNDTFVLKSMPPLEIDGKLRYTLNGISFVNPNTPIRLADKFNRSGEYNLDFPTTPLTRPPRMDKSAINATYKHFIEIILQNNDSVVQSFHMDGYSFFIVGMGYGEWTNSSRTSYNLVDAIFRCTTQVFPGGWTAIRVSLDNAGVWNLRAENLDRWYLGQETYMRIVNPQEKNTTELPAPDNVLYCGALANLSRPPSPSPPTTCSSASKLDFTLLMVFSAPILFLAWLCCNILVLGL
ncbi:monocopper oxidase-like protein SKU5 isoform X1 [Actinidia eriantha]|uniref:monocopper oxidase-like protein SKU5 isoform X1 n=1 Tax=Actinidia eriantha TaxID=165200 RepID=UPI0025832CC1|nr:monocopper oxidase-like protein SKU5 isoform X1 [Actinidia eriantha]